MSINVNGKILSSSVFDSLGNIVNDTNIVTKNLVVWYDAGNLSSYNNSSNYYDCGYGCQYYSSDPGCINCDNQIKDMSGLGNDGTLQLTSVIYNNNGGNMSFSGSGYYVGIGVDPIYASPENITLDFWCYPMINSNYQYLISNSRDCCGSYYGYSLNVSGLVPRFDIWNGGIDYVISSMSINQNTYNNIVATYDGSVMNIYVNGVLRGTTYTTLGIGSPASFGTFIGRMGLDPYYAYTGYIPISRIYNRSLSEYEILQNFNTDRKRFNI